METNIKIFKSLRFGEVRVATTESGEYFFHATDVAKSLGYGNPAEAIVMHCKSGNIEKRYVPHEKKPGGVFMQFIPESEVYRLIMRSKLPQAEQFQDWVVEEILPSVRKTGGYIVAKENDTDEMIMARGLLAAQNAIERQQRIIEEQKRTNSILQASIEANKPKLDYFDEVLKASNGHTITTIAAGYNMSAVSLNRLLQIGGVIRKTGREYSVMAKYQAEKIAKPDKFPYVNSKGEKCTKNDLRWTERGHAVIHEKIKNAISVGALILIKGRYQISQKWLDNYMNEKKKANKQSQNA